MRRKFKFPLKSDSASNSPTSTTGFSSVPVSASSDAPQVHADSVQSDEASDGKAEVGGSGTAPGKTVTEEPETIERPVTPIVTITPPAESTEQVPSSVHPDPHPHATTIDEAIAEFDKAVGKEKDRKSSGRR